MGTICLSLAPILRCESLTRVEAIALIIPPALEIVFAIGLVILKRGTGKKHLLLSAEGLVYFTIALLDLLIHLIPGAHHSLSFFKGIDTTIGVISFAPLLLFTLFLFFFTSQEVLPSFPRKLQKTAKYILLFLIPIILLLNELASLVGISYRALGRNADGSPLVVVQLTDRHVRTFLNSFTLVLLVIYQALNFCVALVRLVKAIINQRRIEASPVPEKEVQSFNGLGWICVGIKLGAIEPLIGFAAGGFGEVLTRRIFRFLSRACLIIGIIKGVDTIEDFSILEPKAARRSHRMSGFRALISNPRNSTFRQIGGADYESNRVPHVLSNANTFPVSPNVTDIASRPTPPPAYNDPRTPTTRTPNVKQASTLRGMLSKPRNALQTSLDETAEISRSSSFVTVSPATDPVVSPSQVPLPPSPASASRSTKSQLPTDGSPKKTKRGSTLRRMISSPRKDTFRQVDGYNYESALEPVPRVLANVNTIPVSPSPELDPTFPTNSGADMTATRDSRYRPPSALVIFPENEMVVVRHKRDRAPTLVMRRLSDLVSTIAEATTAIDRELASPPLVTPPFPSSQDLDRYLSRHTLSSFRFPQEQGQYRASNPIMPTRHESMLSIYSNDSLEIVHDLAMRFPGLPPRVTPKTRKSSAILPMNWDEESLYTSGESSMYALSRSNSEKTVDTTLSSLWRTGSNKRKPVPLLDIQEAPEVSEDIVVIAPGDHAESDFLDLQRSETGHSVSTGRETVSTRHLSITTTFTYTKAKDGGFTMAMANIPPLPSTIPSPTSRISFASTTGTSRRFTSPYIDASGMLVTSITNRTSDLTLEFPWHGKDVHAEGEAVLEHARKVSGVTRIKSVGNAPRRRTPSPIVIAAFTRDSVVAEQWYENINPIPTPNSAATRSSGTPSTPGSGKQQPQTPDLSQRRLEVIMEAMKRPPMIANKEFLNMDSSTEDSLSIEARPVSVTAISTGDEVASGGVEGRQSFLDCR
ncbi:hypothetical protein ABKN59_006225 [Abortiporus biennis]